MSYAPIEETELDLTHLNRELDRVKTHVFMGKSAAFLGSLMCYLNFIWSEDLPTAAVDGTNFYWNPKWFLELKPEVRRTVLMHELWHIALLHIIRVGDKNHKVWNWACDIVINNMLETEGYSFEGTDPWKDQSYGDKPADEIYDLLMAQMKVPPKGKGAWGPANPNDPTTETDMLEPTSQEKQQAINNVVQAAHAARINGQAGSIPGEVEKVLKQFLAPIIPWEALLQRFFQDLMEHDYSWQVRDRRYQSIYLPGEYEDTGRLEHLAYFLDVSGSVTDAQVVRFNSEVKYIKDTFKPRKLTLLQFDTRITSVKEFSEEEPFEELVVVGRGGTDLEPVRQKILEMKPTAAIVFSDLCCAPMGPIPEEFPIIWVAIANHQAQVPFGQIIHIKG